MRVPRDAPAIRYPHTAAKRLKDISLLLQSKVDELFPIPQWFLSKEQLKNDQIDVSSDAVSAAN